MSDIKEPLNKTKGCGHGGKRANAGRIRYSPMSRPNNHKIKIELGW